MNKATLKKERLFSRHLRKMVFVGSLIRGIIFAGLFAVGGTVSAEMVSTAAHIEVSSNLTSQAAWAPSTTFTQTNASVSWKDHASTNVQTRFCCPVDLTALETYARSPSDTNSCTLVATYPGTGETTYVYEMVSQNWLTSNEVDQPLWKHWLSIIVPDTQSHSSALLHITAGNIGAPAPNAGYAGFGVYRGIAIRTESVVAELMMVPNEPLTFSGESFTRTEDALMAYAWDKFLDHGDSKWIPRLPMTKASVVAMDSIVEIRAGANPVNKFVVTGASKRGWTTWTSAIVDDRVEAIIPVVIDILNLTPCLKHYWKSVGDWAPALADYEAIGILERLDTPEWDALMAIEDPFSYRDQLTLPKFIMNSACDEFYFPDSSQFYFDDLKGVKYLTYFPNEGHGLNHWEYTEACYHAVINSSELPQFTWEQETENTIKVTTTTAPTSVVLWQAAGFNNTRDFKITDIGSSAYTSTILTDEGGGVYRGTVPNPASGYKAYFIEMNYPGSDGGKPFKFTTNVKVVPDTYPASWPPE